MGLLQKVMNHFGNTRKETETVHKEAASYADSPQIYEIEMFRIATDRMSIIEDINELCGENGDIRFQRANQLIAADATAGGFSVIVQGSERDKARKRKQGKAFPYSSPGTNRAQQVIDEFLLRTKLNRLAGQHAAALLREGDLFLNVLVDLQRGLVTQVRRAPTLSIKKNVDEYGEFFDPLRAFSQFDTLNPAALQFLRPPECSRRDFAIYQMNHIRWMPDESKIYGCSQYAVARKNYRMLQEMEKALAYRRMYRSVSKRAHKLPEGASPDDVVRYKRENAMIDANGKPTRNAHLLSDFVGNVDVTALHDQANLDEIADIELMENNIWVSLLVPKPLITGGQSINRDILKVQYPKYLESLQTITDTLEYGDSQMYSGYRDIIDLQLMLSGINPETVKYDIVWKQKSDESALDRIDRVQQALGKNGGKQIITLEKAVQVIANDFDIEDPALAIEQIAAERDIQQETVKNKPTVLPSKEGPLQAIKDEHTDDFDKLDELTENLQQKVDSFFYAIAKNTVKKTKVSLTDDVDESIDTEITEEDILEAFDIAWDEAENDFTEQYIMLASMAAISGGRRAINLLSAIYIEKHLSVKILNPIEAEEITEWLREESGQRITAIKETTRKQIRECLANGFENNKGWQQLRVELRRIIASPVRAEMIARTELSWAYSEYNLKVYREAGVQMVQWLVTDDLRCCDACRVMNGQVFPINQCPALPKHPRCRCCYLPVI